VASGVPKHNGVDRLMAVTHAVAMDGIEVSELGGPEVLSYVEISQPSPGPGEVLIKAEAIGVNFIDTYFRTGLCPRELRFVLGAEVAGTVAATGAGVTGLRVGDRVATADAIGAHAEYCVAPVDLVATLPDDVASDVAAAALLKGMTAHLLVKSVYPVQRGDTVLLHVRARSDGNGVAAVYDGVGKSTFDASLASLAVRGTLALFGASSGPVPPLDPQRLNAAGSVYLTRPSRIHFVRSRDEFAWRTGELFDAIAAGVITVTVSAHTTASGCGPGASRPSGAQYRWIGSAHALAEPTQASE
jgi:NADPH2:quinone reductase